MWVEVLLFLVAVASAEDHVRVYDGVLNASACEGMVNATAGQETALIPLSGPQWGPWDELLYRVFGDYLRRYAAQFDLPNVTHDTGYSVILRRRGDPPMTAAYSKRVDLVLAALLFLNDDVGGGNLEVSGREIEPRCGRLVMMPNAFTHPIRLRDVRVGELRLVATWFSAEK